MESQFASTESDKVLAFVRPFGRHTLALVAAEKYGVFKKIKYIAGDTDRSKWDWLGLKRVDLVNTHLSSLRFGLTFWSYLGNLENLLVGVDIIDVPEVYSFCSRQVLKSARGRPVVVTVIETIPNHITSRLPPLAWNTRYVLKHASLLVALTNRARTYLLTIGAEPEKIKVIPQGVDVELFHPDQLRRNDDLVRILFVSPLIERRGLQELMKAFRRLADENRDVELWLVGEGPLREIAETYASRYPIKLFGQVPFKDLPPMYRACDIFCLPGKDTFKFGLKILEDGQFTIAVLEAMASGLPIVTTDSGAYPEVLGSSKFVIGQGEVEQLYKKLRLLSTDRDLRELEGARNRERARQYFDARKQFETYARELARLM